MEWIFYIPEYSEKSGGVVMCHYLAEALTGIGEKVYRWMWNTKLGPEVNDQVVFYPEVISDNPLNAKRVVRCLFNGDGALTGRKVGRDNNEYVFTYSRIFDKELPVLHYPFYDEGLFNLDGSIPPDLRRLSIAYAGKNHHLLLPDGVMEPLLIMTRDWPADRKLLARLLKEAKVLYTSDCMTALTTEALMCGCAPVITDWKGWTLEDGLRSETPQVFQLNQEMDFSEGNVLKKREELLEFTRRIKAWFPDNLKRFVADVKTHFKENDNGQHGWAA